MRSQLVASSAVVLALTMLPGVAAGQQGSKTGDILVPDAAIIDFEAEEIVGTPTTPQQYKERVDRTTDRLHMADLALRFHLKKSMDALMQGHQEGFVLFRNWYRKRDADLREAAAQREVVAKIFGQALDLGLNFFIPGSGVFVSSFKKGLTVAYNQAAEQVGQFKGGDPDLFLEAQQQGIEKVRSAFVNQADAMPNQQAEAFENLRWEYLFDLEERGGNSSDLSPRMRQLAAQYGIPVPDDKTIERTRLAVLEAQIRAVFEADPRQQGDRVAPPQLDSNDVYFTAISREEAYKQAYPGQPDRYCPIQIEFWGLGLGGAGTECRRWRSASR